MIQKLCQFTRKNISFPISACSAGLLAIWPIPETIALRYLLMGVGFLVSLVYLSRESHALFKYAAWPIWVFLSIYAWILIHLAFFSTQYSLQLSEVSSIWLRTLLIAPLGLALGLEYSKRIAGASAKTCLGHGGWPLIILFTGLSGLSLISAGRYFYEVYQTLNPIHMGLLYSFYKAKQPFVIANVLLLPLCFILILRALNTQERKVWIAPATIGILLSIFSSYFSNTKNGIAIFAIVLIVFLWNLLLKTKPSIRNFFAGIGILVILGGTSYLGISKHLEHNPQWLSMIADAKIGIDIDHQNRWKNSGAYPHNGLGKVVDISTYERSAWFVAGSRLLAENPLGYGLLNHSFGALASAKWPDYKVASEKFRGATHSGWLDFALGLGIPGLLLVLIPLWASWYRALYQDGLWYSYASWTIPIMSFAYLTTEVAVSHFIEMLFFMTAFFCGLTLRHPVKHCCLGSK